MTETEVGFKELFRGRTDAYGLVKGSCIREPVKDDLWLAHLTGGGSLGVYPVIHRIHLTAAATSGSQHLVRWGCTDLDVHGPRGMSEQDCWVHALNLSMAFRVLGHRAWIELTKSRGYHVWVFATDWVDALAMRNTFLVAHKLADVPVVEVNPKDAEGRTELGNYVNLPYAHLWATADPPTRVMLSIDGTPWTLPDFVEQALASRSTPDRIDETARLYVPPAPRSSVTLRPFTGLTEAPQGGYGQVSDISDPQLRASVDRLCGAGRLIFRDGPLPAGKGLPAGGRGWTLFRLGLKCREAGLTPDEALPVLIDADWRWGKLMSGVDGHRDGMRYIVKMVEDIYG